MEFASVVPACLAWPLQLEPFPGVFLSPSRVGDPGAVRALARPYVGEGSRLQAWRRDGLLTLDSVPGLHVYEYVTGGLTIRGLIGALDLTRLTAADEPPALWPHERVHTDQVEDLARRMAAIGINPAPILLSVSSPDGLRTLLDVITERAPDHAFTDRTGQTHRIWSVTDLTDLAQLQDCVAHSEALLADGHHRYAAYLALRDAHPDGTWDHGLAMLVDQADTPFFLGPIHRVVHGITLDDLVRAAHAAGAQTISGDRPAMLDQLSPGAIVLTDGSQWLTVTPPTAQDALVVEWLHSELLARLGDVDLSHHHTLESALKATGALDAALVLPAPSLQAVTALTRAGHLLPEKATSFQPKPTVGAIMRNVTADRPCS